MNKLIGIAGTNGSGKDSLGELLSSEYGWKFISVTRDLLRAEARKLGMPIERKSLRTISAQWRRQHGLGVLVDKAVETYNNSTKKYNGLAIASLRNPGEADSIHELGGVVVWVDAEPKIRYDRVQKRLRSNEDHKTYEEFLSEEAAEMHNYGDEAALSGVQVKAKADIFLENNGNDIKAFKNYAEKELKNYL